MERCKHVKSQATTVYFRLGKLRRVSTYVQHVWGIIGHVTAEAGNTVGTDGAPPQDTHFHSPVKFRRIPQHFYFEMYVCCFRLTLGQLLKCGKSMYCMYMYKLILKRLYSDPNIG